MNQWQSPWHCNLSKQRNSVSKGYSGRMKFTCTPCFTNQMATCEPEQASTAVVLVPTYCKANNPLGRNPCSLYLYLSKCLLICLTTPSIVHTMLSRTVE
jgi:hypothetical protein